MKKVRKIMVNYLLYLKILDPLIITFVKYLDIATVVVIITSLLFFLVCSFMQPGHVRASLNWLEVL